MPVSMLALGCGGDDVEVRISRDASTVDQTGRTSQDASRPSLDGGVDGADAGDRGTRGGSEAGSLPSGESVTVLGSFLLDHLTDAQYHAKCLEMQASVGAVATQTRIAECTGAGLIAAQRRSGTCDEKRAQCLRDEEANTFDLDALFDCSVRDTSGSEACAGLTVSEFDACTQSYRNRAERFATFTCLNTSREVEQAVMAVGTVSPECQVLEAKCP